MTFSKKYTIICLGKVSAMFAKKIKSLRLEKNLTQEQLAKELGMSKSAISMYENGRRSPDLETAELIADYFNVNMDELVMRSEIKNRNEFLYNLGFLPPPETVKRPRLGNISCGEPIMSEENFDGYDDVPTSVRCDFTLIAQGDSMTGAGIFDGDIVYIKQQPVVENGEIAAVLVDGCEKLLKRVFFTKNSVVLQAENPNYPPLTFVFDEMNNVQIIGKATGFTRILNKRK